MAKGMDTVRRAIGKLPRIEAGLADPDDPIHVSPTFSQDRSLERMRCEAFKDWIHGENCRAKLIEIEVA